ncbi:hypothetical protein [Streptomyces javensis]|uniref:Uncharacterized protein n=1 Tax=Streptomyces javensis TaxID=114698 RepID=A0ABN1WL37_9ACTN
MRPPAKRPTVIKAAKTANTVTLFFFPILSSGLGTDVYWVILSAPVLGLIALLVKRWEPVRFDADAEERARVGAETARG